LVAAIANLAWNIYQRDIRFLNLVKLKGAAKAAFLRRINKGRAKAGLKRIASKSKSVSRKVTSKIKRPKRRVNNVVRRGALPKRPRRRDTIKSLYDKKTLKQIAVKTVIGLGLGITIKLAAMFSRNRSAIIIANRAAPTVAAYAGGGTGELAFQAADFIITRGSLNVNGNIGNGFSSGGA